MLTLRSQTISYRFTKSFWKEHCIMARNWAPHYKLNWCILDMLSAEISCSGPSTLSPGLGHWLLSLASLYSAGGNHMAQNCSHWVGQTHTKTGKGAKQRPGCSPSLQTAVRPAATQPQLQPHSPLRRLSVQADPNSTISSAQSPACSLSAIVTDTMCTVLLLYWTCTDDMISLFTFRS